MDNFTECNKCVFYDSCKEIGFKTCFLEEEEKGKKIEEEVEEDENEKDLVELLK